jgi:5'-3' exonuclease
MGIKNLNHLLRKQCPWVFREVHLSDFAYQIVAIDTSLFMCKYKSLADNWLESFVSLILCLRKNDIHCIFIFDTGHPPEKNQEKEERIQAREKLKIKIEQLESSLKKYIETDVLDNELQLLLLKENEVSDDKSSKIETLQTIIDDKRRAIINITPEDWAQLKRLLDAMNVSYYQAPLEAETMCADLCKRGIVAAALTDDTDVLAYGSTIVLSKIDIYNSTAIQTMYQDVLEALKLTEKQFLDLCIMCGTDYNKNIPRVGCLTAYKYISLYGSIEEIERQKGLDIAILKHGRNRELFLEYERFTFAERVRYNGPPDYEKLEQLVTTDLNRVRRHLKPKLVFIQK